VPAKLDLRELAKAQPLRTAARSSARTESAAPSLATLPPAERRAMLLELVREEASIVFRLPARAVADDEPLKTMGLDSLMALELRDRLGAKLQLALSATLTFDHPTVAQLAEHLDELVPRATPEPAVPPTPPVFEIDEPARAIENLSNDELVTLVRSL
jgi:acyl carrier protein